MSQSEIDRFIKDFKTNTEFQAEVASGIAEIAVALGYSVSADEVRSGIVLRPGLTEDEEDLGHISGELLRDAAKRKPMGK